MLFCNFFNRFTVMGKKRDKKLFFLFSYQCHSAHRDCGMRGVGRGHVFPQILEKVSKSLH